MNVSFVNGSDEQQAAFMLVINSFLNLPSDNLDVSVSVEFVPDPLEVGDHDQFAFTNGTTINIRDDAPGFEGLDPDGTTLGMPFFNEVVAHHIGHAILESVFSTETQEEIALLFDTTPAEWNPSERALADRPIEGICETFKDAFVPRHLRT